MTEMDVVDQLKQCLKLCIQRAKGRSEEVVAQRQSRNETSMESASNGNNLPANLQTFSLDPDKDNLMKDITRQLESLLKEWLPKLSKTGRNHLLDFLCENQYDSDRNKFTNPFNEDTLNILIEGLKGLLASLDAYDAAWSGRKSVVEDYLRKYPSTKDRTGLWGTTLLYSAARNNHFDLVRYLVDDVKCSVNAQNQQHIKRALAAKITKDDNFQANPSAGSTALHGACYNGHLEIVKFLVEHGADYFIRNHADETAITHATGHPNILQYFQKILVLGYSLKSTDLPDKPILEEAERCVFDCMWEYKPYADQRWFSFSSHEAKQLQNALSIGPNQSFKREIHLKVRNGIFRVSLIEFLRSGRNSEENRKPAWIRCRGSSIGNFKIYAVWQIMIHKHPSAVSGPSMNMMQFPTITGGRFKIQLDSWYFCDARISEEIDRAMRNRRKQLKITMDHISKQCLLFDLQDFTFSAEDKSVHGSIRWIPKMVSNNSQDSMRLIGFDEFQTLGNMDPIPLTVARLKKTSMKTGHQSSDDVKAEEENSGNETSQVLDRDDLGMDSVVFEDDDDLGGSTNQAWTGYNGGVCAINDYIDSGSHDDPHSAIARGSTASSTSTLSSRTTTATSTDIDIDEPIESFLNERVAAQRSDEEDRISLKSCSVMDDKLLDDMKSELSQLKDEKDNLRGKLEEKQSEIKKLQSDAKQAAKYEQELAKMKRQIQDIENEARKNMEKQEKINKILKSIKGVDYKHIRPDMINKVFAPKLTLILKYLQEKSDVTDPTIADRVPKIAFDEHHGDYTITVIGLPKQHDEFKAMLERIISVFKLIESAKTYYNGQLNRVFKLWMKDKLPKVASKTPNWVEYMGLFEELFKAKKAEYQKMFDEYMEEQMKKSLDRCILDKWDKPWVEIKTLTNDYMSKNQFVREINDLKQKALDEFIEKNIFSQTMKLESKPTPGSIKVLRNYIHHVQEEFRKNPEYQGYGMKQFAAIPKLLQRLILYYASFKVQLPLFEHSEDLLQKIEKNAVTTISTSTGSGKSTLLPALLIADGYDKVIVTQPRRLPCQLICKRVNSTMPAEIRPSSADPLAGWAVSGAERNPQAKVLYLTDGLLKERLLYDRNFINQNTHLDKSVVFFIDEVHERSVNIDLCLALLARLLTVHPELKSKMKVIISSATLDGSVPTLFRKIPNAGLGEFAMPNMGTLHPVTKIDRRNENVLDIVQELCKKRRRHEQILCFVSSVGEVNQCCRLIGEVSHGTIVAFPLVQSQHPNVQQENIEHGTVFFSTTVAETSLTFPCLKYVIDTGMINVPVYDYESKRTVLREIRAAESTIKQRLGRLGRTLPGEYYSVYDYNVADQRFPIPQIRQSDLMNIEFSLRKSPLKKGFDYLKQFLPDPPTDLDIKRTVDQLDRLSIVEKGSSHQLTKHGEALAKLPDFGSLAMSKAVLAALCDYNCGRDLICLSAILGVLNTTMIFKSIPQSMKSSDGDFMTLLKVMNAILLIRQQCSPRQIDIDQVCQQKGLGEVRHVIRQALRRYTTLEKSFERIPEYREKAQIQSEHWESIARSLLAGYWENVFVSLKELQDRVLHFIRYDGSGDIAVLDLQSTLTRPISTAPVALVLARDIRHSTAVRERAVLSFVGELKAEWIEHRIQRNIKVTGDDEGYINANNILGGIQSMYSGRVNASLSSGVVSLTGSAGSVLKAELELRQNMVHDRSFSLGESVSGAKPHINFARNLESVMKMPWIFNPMKWRWKAQRQVEITVQPDTSKKTCEVVVKGRASDFQDVKREFDAFIGWLQPCAVIRHPRSGVAPRVLRPPIRQQCKDIEERIGRVTDPKRTPIDIHHSLRGTQATRETRMEVVAWLAVCKFGCKVEGGFVRDWIVGHYTSRPTAAPTNPASWITYVGSTPYLDKELVPCDLDCHLPSDAYFDIEKFRDELYKVEISCQVIREEWRYILLLDADSPKGAFTMDLIEPHVALTHDRIDFDVNNLFVEKDYTHELGMRIDVEQRPYSIDLETIIDNIKNKRFQVLRPIDKYVTERMKKMIDVRGWTHTGKVFPIIPEPHFKQNAILVPLPRESPLYIEVATKMQSIPGVRIYSIEQIRNPFLEETYEGMKKIIKKQCPGFDPNEVELFHGTSGTGIEGIVEDGFDDRYYSSSGLYGHGAYFADDPIKSHAYTAADPTDNTRVMFFNKVCLGKPHTLTNTDQTLVSAPHGHHSIIGKHSDLTEYIVYRYGQALPYLKMIYTA